MVMQCSAKAIRGEAKQWQRFEMKYGLKILAAFFFVMLFIYSLQSRDESREWSQPGFLQLSPTVSLNEGLTGPSKGLRGTSIASPRNHIVVSFFIGAGKGGLESPFPFLTIGASQMKNLKEILIFAQKMLGMTVFGLFCVFFGWTLNGKYGVEKQVKDSLPTIEEIQRRIGANPDGRLGSETQAKWELALCDQYAKKYFEPRINTDSTDLNNGI
jgi:hypothetical protein